MVPTISVVSIDQVIADSRCQIRAGVDLGLVYDYAEAIKSGADMPPLSVVESSDGYYLYDGFHRIEAYRQVGTKEVPISSTPGGLWDAMEKSCSVNAVHGKRRTNEDKHRAVETMIRVMEHKGENWSNSEVARRCAVSESLVRSLRPDFVLNEVTSERTYTDRYGNQSTMNTSNIGKSQIPKVDLNDIAWDDTSDDYEDVDDDGVIHDTTPSPRPGITPKTSDNYSPSVAKSEWFSIPDAEPREAAMLIRANMLAEHINALVDHLEGRG